MIRFLKSNWRKYDNVKYDKESYLKEYVINEKEEAVVSIQIKDMKDVISDFSVSKFRLFKQEFIDHMDRIIYHIPLKYSIELQFTIHNATEQEKIEFSEMIRNHYGLSLEDKRQDLKINLLIIWALFAIGVVFLSFSYALAANGKGQLVTDTINIAGTFALWEMVDLYLLDRKAKKFALKNVAQTYLAKHVFCDKETI